MCHGRQATNPDLAVCWAHHRLDRFARDRGSRYIGPARPTTRARERAIAEFGERHRQTPRTHCACFSRDMFQRHFLAHATGHGHRFFLPNGWGKHPSSISRSIPREGGGRRRLVLCRWTSLSNQQGDHDPPHLSPRHGHEHEQPASKRLSRTAAHEPRRQGEDRRGCRHWGDGGEAVDLRDADRVDRVGDAHIAHTAEPVRTDVDPETAA